MDETRGRIRDSARISESTNGPGAGTPITYVPIGAGYQTVTSQETLSPIWTAPIMQSMIFVTGFARGGTSWLRDCIGSHPEIAILPREHVVFRNMKDPDEIRAYFQRQTSEIRNEVRFVVTKAPANAPFVGWAARAFPESRFVFIIRDPRDVLVSHQRGIQAWMKGANSTVQGCMHKIQNYYQGWLDAVDLPNVRLVRYEDLHQDFFATMNRVFSFVGVEASRETLREVLKQNSFQARTNRSNVEDRTSAKRKGVIGEWCLQLCDKEIRWYQESEFFRALMREHGYGWTEYTYGNILSAMRAASVHFLSEDDLLARRLDPTRPNVVVQHDIDSLRERWCATSVMRTAEIEAELGVAATYNFLPVDDVRYRPGGKKTVLPLIERVRSINPRADIGLHVNACERFYPASAPEAGRSPPDLGPILEYLRRQVVEYKSLGITFRTATAHGYGRAKKLPNNRDTREIQETLAEEGILLFDTTIREELKAAASHACALTDVGGLLKPRNFEHGYDLVDSKAYGTLPDGSFLRFLTHPGNYPVDVPSTVAMRAAR